VTERGERHGVGAVVLTGGGAVRLGGADKATIEVGGRTLLEHALAALADVPEVVVVGPEVPTSRPVTFTREDPPGGGPAAGLLAGLERFARRPAYVVVTAVDMPLVSAATVARLVQAAAGDGAVLVDDEGRLQYLCAVYSVAALQRSRRAGDEHDGHGLPMRRLVGTLDLVQVPAVGSEARDLDTWEDLATLREAFGAEDPPAPGGHGSHTGG
jgi:molybdopterin-guanine dinucleotide biosynthesis protein A